MKKTIFAIIATAAMVACSNDEIISQAAPEAIGFNNAFVDNSTRSANDPSFTNDDESIFEDFAVYGFVENAVLFNGTRVSKEIVNNSLSSAWKYEGTQYWIAGADYNFSAVAPLTGADWTLESSSAAGLELAFTNNGGVQDVLYAQTQTIEGKASGNLAVALTFRHILSKVKFSFENAYNADNTTIRVSNIRITNAHASGDVALGYNTTEWDNQSGSVELAFGNATTDDAVVADAVAFGFGTTLESYNELLLIPGAVTGGYEIAYTYEILVNGSPVQSFNKTATVDFTPEAGHAYDFKATITPGEAIEFTVSVEDWTNEAETTM